MGKTNVILLEDNRILRESLLVILNDQPDIEAKGIDSKNGVRDQIRSLNPHIIIVSVGQRNVASRALVELLCQTRLAHVIVMSLMPAEGDMVEYVNMGVSGFILQDAGVVEFLATVRGVASGAKIVPRQ